MTSHKYKAMNSEQKHNFINMAAVVTKDNITTVSFDIFDTLVISPFWKSSDVYFLMEREFKNAYTGRKTFHELRIKAESKAIKKCGLKKPTLEEIYCQLQKMSKISPASAEKLMNRELELILYYSYPRDCGLRLYNEALDSGKKVVLTTDSYLPNETIGQILKDCGIEGYKAVFIKNPEQLKRVNGSIFSIMISKLGLKHNELVHVGGDLHEDVEVPVSQGIEAVYMPSTQELLKKSGRLVDYIHNKIGNSFEGVENLNLRCILSLYSEFAFDYPGAKITTGDFCGSYENMGFALSGTIGLLKDYAVSNEIESKILAAFEKDKRFVTGKNTLIEMYEKHFDKFLEAYGYKNCDVIFKFFVKHAAINDTMYLQKYMSRLDMQDWTNQITEPKVKSANNTEYHYKKSLFDKLFLR